MNRSLLANVAACCAALCAGASVVVTRFAVGEIDPVTLAFYRYAIAMICLLPVLPFVWPKARV
ncbi:MAG: EamA family transporter, partial [Pseudolabrys sp.]